MRRAGCWSLRPFIFALGSLFPSSALPTFAADGAGSGADASGRHQDAGVAERSGSSKGGSASRLTSRDFLGWRRRVMHARNRGRAGLDEMEDGLWLTLPLTDWGESVGPRSRS